MTLPPFELHRPSSLHEAAEMAECYGDSASFYCGGTELLLLMKLGLAQYEHLINIRDIPELQGVSAEDGALHIGAASTHRRLERSAIVEERWPAFARMEQSVANVRVRSAGTLGGNLCFADPHSDPGTFLLVTGADLICRKGSAQRVVPIVDFLLGPYQTILTDGEILATVRVPDPPAGAGIVHKKLSFHERPAATVTCLVQVCDGRVAETRIAVGSVGVVPVRVPGAERTLLGLSADTPDPSRLDQACDEAAEASNAVEDSNGSPEYKRNLVRVLLKRCLNEALHTGTV